MIHLLRISRPIQDILLSGLAVTASVILLTAFVSAWTVPAATPPSGNVGAPINTGATYQIKSGSLGANGVAVFGNSILQANSYLNFGTTSGTSSYGIRDVSGGLQFKNQNGQWSSLASTTASFVSSSQWQSGSGGVIYYTAGNVGINTSVPVAPLDINGTVRLSGQTAAPVTCNAARKGSIAMTSSATVCICNGSLWVVESNGAVCAWNVTPGSQYFSASGSFTVPNYNTLTIEVWGGGGGGGGTRVAGGTGGQSAWNGVMFANGGTGGDGYGTPGSGGTASGGTPTTGNAGTATNGGSAPGGGGAGGASQTVGTAPGGGGGAGIYVSGAGGGGSGGYTTTTYSAGQIPVGASIPIVVGAGGSPGSGAGAGAAGGVYIEWN